MPPSTECPSLNHACSPPLSKEKFSWPMACSVHNRRQAFPFMERLGLGVVALGSIEFRQVVEARGHVGVL